MPRIPALGTVIFVLMLDVVVGGPAAAQVASYDEYRVSSLLQRIERAERIRVLFASGQVIEIEGPTIRGYSLIRGYPLAGVERRSRDSVESPVSEIRQVWVRGSAALTGLAVGAILGGFTGAVGAVSFAQYAKSGKGWCWGYCVSTRLSGDEKLKIAAIRALAGGATAGLVGMFGSVWLSSHTIRTPQICDGAAVACVRV